jgi:DNA-binding MarR family transcriptional regulator
MNVTTSQTSTRSADHRVPAELVASTSFLLKRLGFAAKERAMAAYEETGLHPYHHAVMLVLDEGSRETQGSIADALGYDRGQLVGLLDELEEQGFVERKRDPNDRRRHLVRLTPDGKKTLRRLRTLAARLDDEFLAPLSDEDRETLHVLLLRLAEVHEPRCAPLGT